MERCGVCGFGWSPQDARWFSAREARIIEASVGSDRVRRVTCPDCEAEQRAVGLDERLLKP